MPFLLTLYMGSFCPLVSTLRNTLVVLTARGPWKLEMRKAPPPGL